MFSSKLVENGGLGEFERFFVKDLMRELWTELFKPNLYSKLLRKRELGFETA